MNNLAPMKNCPWGVLYAKVHPRLLLFVLENIATAMICNKYWYVFYERFIAFTS